MMRGAVKRNTIAVAVLFVFSILVFPVCGLAQAQSGPQTYSLSETNALFGPEMNVEVHRDGNMVLVDSSSAGAAGSKGIHTRTLYDLRVGKSYTADLVNPSTPCGAGTFSGDWGDPFAMSAELLGDLANKNPKTVGTETIAGLPTKIMEAHDAASKTNSRVWVDEQHHLIARLQMTQGSSPAKTIIALKQFSLAKPAASLFVLPPGCKASSAPAQPSASDRIASATGGNAGDYANAIMPPPSKNACTVLFKVVEAGTMKPVMSGFQVAVDTQVNPEHLGSYSISQDQKGHVTFSGGNLHEMTAQMHNGVLRIDNAPPQFDMELAFGQAGDSSALIYRQCFGPQTTLLFVMKNRQKLSDGGDWLWVKKQ